MTTNRLEPIHPGEILEEEFIRPLGLSANALAKALDVPVTRVSDILRGRRGITADTALRFGRFFGTSPDLWLGLQSEYDLRVARRDFGESIESHVLPLKGAVGRYENNSRSASGNSRVREALSMYGPGRVTRRTLDRRRTRRSS
jgi:addiction module HigA family antidote